MTGHAGRPGTGKHVGPCSHSRVKRVTGTAARELLPASSSAQRCPCRFRSAHVPPASPCLPLPPIPAPSPRPRTRWARTRRARTRRVLPVRARRQAARQASRPVGQARAPQRRRQAVQAQAGRRQARRNPRPRRTARGLPGRGRRRRNSRGRRRRSADLRLPCRPARSRRAGPTRRSPRQASRRGSACPTRSASAVSQRRRTTRPASGASRAIAIWTTGSRRNARSTADKPAAPDRRAAACRQPVRQGEWIGTTPAPCDPASEETPIL